MRLLKSACARPLLHVEVLERREQPNDMFGLGGLLGGFLTFDLETGCISRKPMPELERAVIERSLNRPAAGPSAPRAQTPMREATIGAAPSLPLAVQGLDYQLEQTAGVFIDLALIPDPGLGGPVTAAPELEPPHQIETQQWTFKAPDPVGAVAQVTCEYGPNKRLYAIGGLFADGTRTDAVREWDPATDTWAMKTPIPVPGGFGGITAYDSAVVVGDKIYVFGGYNQLGVRINVFNTTSIYDISANTWSRGAPMPDERFGPAVGYDGADKIYLMGGASAIIAASTWEYTISTNTWAVKAPMATGMYRGHGAIDTISGALHSYGNGLNSPEHRVYDYVANSHRAGLPVPVGITDPGTASIPGLGLIQVVAGAGANGSGAPLTHIYESITPSWLGSFPGNPGGNVSNTCGAIFFDGVDGIFSMVGGFNGATTVAHNQFIDWI